MLLECDFGSILFPFQGKSPTNAQVLLHLQILALSNNLISHPWFLIFHNLLTKFQNKIKFIPKIYLSGKLLIHEKKCIS